MATGRREFRRGRADAQWRAGDLAVVVEAILTSSPEVLWSADDLRARLAFGHEGAGPPASSVREALRALEDAGRVERVDVWGRVGWGGTRHGFRARRGARAGRLAVAA